MTGGLRALLAGILDYAGLFPPAALDMAGAVESYARYREGRFAWMLGPFVCPAPRLNEFAEAAAPFLAHAGAPWTLSLLPRAAADADTFAASFAEDVVRAAEMEQGSGGRVRVTAVEARWPDAVVRAAHPAGPVRETAARVALDLRRLPEARQFFVELGFAAAEEPALRSAAEAVASVRGAFEGHTLGLKIRTGGTTADAFPSPETVAAFVAAARATGLPFKATAGLHHPVRAAHESVDAPMHGFLNVFAGAALYFADALDRTALIALLYEEDAASFRFTDEEIAWRNARCPAAAVERARARFALSFGSCSFTEPLEDLAALGLLVV